MALKLKRILFNILEPEKYKELFLGIDKDFDRVDFLSPMLLFQDVLLWEGTPSL